MKQISVLLSLLLFLHGVTGTSWATAQQKPTPIQLSPEQFRRIVSEQMQAGPVTTKSFLLAQTDNRARTKDPKKDEPIQEEDPKKDEEAKATEDPPGPPRVKERKASDPEPVYVPVENLNSFVNSVAFSNAEETAYIIFAVVGAVVVIAWLAYVPVLLYDMLVENRNLELSHLLTFQHTHLYLDREVTDKDVEGNLAGLRYSLFLEEDRTYGVASELGYFDVSDSDRGAYWLLGPSIMLGKADGAMNDFFTKFDLLAGSSFHRDVGLVSKVDVTFHFGVLHPNFYLGLGAGAMYIDVKGNEGVAKKIDELGLSLLSSATWSF